MAEVRAAPYCPYGGCRDLWETRDRHVCIHGPSGTGKTRATLEKLDLAARKYPGMRGLLLRSTRASLTHSILVTYEEHVLPLNDPVKRGANREGRRSYHYRNGSELVLGGLDEKYAGRVMSTEYDMVAVFQAEEISEDSWEKLDTRLRNGRMPYHQMIADCNPAGPTHWLKRRIDAGTITGIASHFEDNPTITPEYLRALSNLTGHRRSRLYEGKWAAAEGLVWPGLEGCFVKPFKPPLKDALAMGGGIDFGWTNPFAALGSVLYEAEDGRDILYVFYERYKTQTELKVHAASLLRVFPEGYGRWQADPAEPDSIHALRRAGLNVRGARNNILTGVDAVTARINTGRLLLSENLTALRGEGAGYCYPQGGNSEKPVDKDNHACCALRYAVMGHDWRKLANVFDVDEEGMT